MTTKTMKRVLASGLTCVIALLIVGWAQTREAQDAALPDGLHSGDVQVRREAAAKLVRAIARKDLKRVLPQLLPLLGDPDVEVRYYTAVALGASAYASEANAETLNQATPSLIASLADEDARVRTAAADAIALMMPHAPQSASGTLVDLLKDKNAEVRTAALGALARMDRLSPEATSSVIATLRQDSEAKVRGKAADVLGAVRNTDSATVSALTEALEDREEFVKTEAIRALGSIGPSASSAVPSLKQMAGDPKLSPTVRTHVDYALRSIEQ
jgi:HEAT repeat protein